MSGADARNAAPFDGFADMYARGQYAPFDPAFRAGGAFGLTLIDVRQGAIETVDPAVPDMAFVRAVEPHDPAEAHFGDGWRRNQGRADWVDVVPAYTEASYRLPMLHLRAVIVPHGTLAAKLDEIGLAPSALDAVTGRFRSLPEAARWLDAAWHASEGGGPAANLALDGAFLSLLSVMLRAGGDARTAHALAPVPAVGDRRIARVLDYVEAHLDRPLDVGELAGVAAISLFHFVRAFRTATGLTPHRYVQHRRVERAKRLLAGHMPLAEVAFACGFASQSHFGQVFKAHTGATPGQWREAVR